MKVDVYTPMKETARYLSKRFHKEIGKDECEEIVMYNVCNIKYKNIEPLLSEFMCEVREFKTGKIIWPKLNKREIKERFGL